MKKTIQSLALLGLIISNSNAYSEEVVSLNQGSCWYQERDSKVKVASFNSGISVELNDEYLSSLNNLNLPVNFDEKYSSQLHCSGHGVSLVMHVQEKEKKYCLWFKIEKNALSIQSIGLTDYDSNCDGYKEAELLVTLSSEAELEDVEKQISQNPAVQSITKASSNVLHVKLTDESGGSEDVIAQQLKTHRAIKYVEKSYFYHPVGEWGELTSLKK
ncbi:hypothetical protein [Halobacteriovorax sp. HLS]|uniref:hypothetical protein n=1 Tax=Halobacteriovorax sp. HLS TaxID=2234000 RepID=UPI000FD9A188|nr:hypothetical protein [Halobacteriovorax sp. HLS]